MQPGKTQWLCAAAVFGVALALYTWTLAPTVTLVDSGELIVAARDLGVAHPPGFPLYVLLAHAATWLPFGNVAERVNFFSALCGALTVGLMVLLAAEALATGPAAGRRGGRVAAPPADTAQQTVPVLVAALLFAFSRTLWSYATLAEVYTLNAALLVLVFFLMLRWRRVTLAHAARRADTPLKNARETLRQAQGEPHAGRGTAHAEPVEAWGGVFQQRADPPLYAAAFVFGLALGVHHVTVLLTLPALALLVIATTGRRFFISWRFASAALCACAGLSVYLYLPIAAWREPLFNWGNPRTLQRLWWHLTGQQYQAYFSFSPGELSTQAVAFVHRAAREFGPWWCPAGLALIGVGCVALFRRDRALFGCLLLMVICNVAYTLGYAIAEDMDAYYLPTYIALAVAAGFGAQDVLRRLQARAVTVAALLLVPVVALAANWSFNNRSRYWIARDYADNVLRTIEPDGMLLTLDWQVAAPLLYVHSIDQQRRDVTVIDVNLLRRSWYFDYLQREYPELMQQTRDAVDAFLEDLTRWEQYPELYQRDAALTRRIDTRFHDMLMVFVREHLRTGPAYITQDIALNRSAQDMRFTQSLAAAYQFVPQGLVFQLVRERAFHDPAEPQLVMRGLADGSLRFEDDDVVQLKVFPVYVSMLYNRGRYLSLYGHHARAAQAFKEALALDSSFAPAQTALAGSLNALRNAETPASR